MSGKFKRSQRHQRWNEAGTCWSDKYLAEVSAVELSPDSPPPLRLLASELLALSRLQRTFGEVEDLRRVLAAFQKLTSAAPAAPATATAAAATAPAEAAPAAPAADVLDAPADSNGSSGSGTEGSSGSSGSLPDPLYTGSWLLAGLLLQEGSRPLHRALLGAVQRLQPEQLAVFGAAVTERLRAALAALDASSPLPELGTSSSSSSSSPTAPTQPTQQPPPPPPL
ncbi:hypothetical protein Agub_g15482, partial [Astrephomene gubernaculifera]